MLLEIALSQKSNKNPAIMYHFCFSESKLNSVRFYKKSCEIVLYLIFGL